MTAEEAANIAEYSIFENLYVYFTMNENEEVSVDLTDEDLAAFDEPWDEDIPEADEDEEAIDAEELPPEEDGEDHEDAQPDDEADTEEGAEEAEEQPEGEEGESEEGNQLFTINYLGKEEQLTREQMVELAQKGRNYDHVVEERDRLRSEASGGPSGDRMKFLEELASRAGLSVDEQIDRMRAIWYQVDQSESGNDVTDIEALQHVQRNKGSKGEKKAEGNSEEGSKLNPQVERFLKAYPNVKGDEIPKEVWESLPQYDGDLVAAYQAHEIKRLKEENAKAKREERQEANNKRSTGSRRTAGATTSRDSFDEGWNS